MAVALLFFLAVLEVTSSMSPVHTTSGRHFVFDIPFANADGRNRRGDTAHVRFKTEEEKFSMVLYFPNRLHTVNTYYLKYKCKMGRGGMCIYKFNYRNLFPAKTEQSLTGKVESDVPICGVIIVSSGNWEAATMFLLLPQHAWSKAYYVTTTDVGYPFVMILTYKTKITARLKFPKFKKTFNVPCGGNRNCASNSIVTLNLKPMRSWKLYIKRRGVSFHNTLIEANHPLYVVAGSTALKYRNGGLDTCAFSLRPNDKWGKEYILPKFGEHSDARSRTFYRITTKRIPFAYEVFQNGKNTHKRLTNYEAFGSLTNFRSPVVIRANVPFGLYQMVTDRGLEAGCLTTVPTEHWRNGDIYYHADEVFDTKAAIRKRVVITTANRKNVYVNGDGTLYWKSSPIVSPSRTYNYGILTVKSFPISVYTRQPNGRLVLYKMLGAPGARPGNAYFAVSFYFSTIYDAGCKKSDPLFNDGVDNDCDGFVDEEWKNGKDDDNDGVIDEDNIETPMEPEWMPWTATCRMDCKGKFHTKRIRDCRRSRYAYIMTRTCKGNDEVCGFEEKTCPNFCKKVQLAKCNRQPGCKVFVSAQSHRCSECKPGYLGHHCLSPCPDGWKGKDCLTAPSKADLRPFGTKAKIEKEKKEKEEKEKAEKEKKEKEQKEKEKKEKARKEKEERERKERERKEKERKEKEEKGMTEKALKKRREKERKERERKEKIRKEKEEQERKERERKEKKEKEKNEMERKEQEKWEKKERDRIRKEEKERKERERKEREELGIKEGDVTLTVVVRKLTEQERKEREKKERERIEKEKKDRKSKKGNRNEENETNASEEEKGNKKGGKEGNKRNETEKIEKEKNERDRIRIEKEKKERDRIEKEKKEKADKERKDKENGSKDWPLILGIVLVGIADAALIGLIIWALRKRRNQNVEDEKKKGEGEEQEEGEKKEVGEVETDVVGEESNLGKSPSLEETHV